MVGGFRFMNLIDRAVAIMLIGITLIEMEESP